MPPLSVTEVPGETSSVTGGEVKQSKTAEGQGPKYNEDANLLEGDDDETDAGVLDTEETGDTKEDKRLEEDTEDQDKTEQEEELPKIAFDRPTITEIKAKYPDFFKDFPQMKESYFREIKFTQLFPTFEDAQEAFNENEAFTTLSDSVLTGDPAALLESIGKTDTKALEVFSTSFLPTLYKKNPELYSQAMTPVFQNLIRSLYADKDENTRNAALLLSDYIFGSDGEAVAKGQKSLARNTQPSEEQKRIKDQREQNLTTAFRTAVGRVENGINRSLETMISKSVSFDPNKVFSPALRRLGTKEVIQKVMSQLEHDAGHMSVMQARWKRARWIYQ